MSSRFPLPVRDLTANSLIASLTTTVSDLSSQFATLSQFVDALEVTVDNNFAALTLLQSTALTVNFDYLVASDRILVGPESGVHIETDNVSSEYRFRPYTIEGESEIGTVKEDDAIPTFIRLSVPARRGFAFLKMTDANILLFSKNVISGVQRDHHDDSIASLDWSGFAQVTREGGGIVYSASLKREPTADPSGMKAAFQKQPVTGFSLLSVEGIAALFGDTQIERIQLVYRKLDVVGLLKQKADIEALLKSANS